MYLMMTMTMLDGGLYLREVVQVREDDLLRGDPRRGAGAEIGGAPRLRPPVRAARAVSSLTASSWGSTPMARSVNGDLPSSSLYIELPFFVALEAPIVLSDAVFG